MLSLKGRLRTSEERAECLTFWSGVQRAARTFRGGRERGGASGVLAEPEPERALGVGGRLSVWT